MTPLLVSVEMASNHTFNVWKADAAVEASLVAARGLLKEAWSPSGEKSPWGAPGGASLRTGARAKDSISPKIPFNLDKNKACAGFLFFFDRKVVRYS